MTALPSATKRATTLATRRHGSTSTLPLTSQSTTGVESHDLVTATLSEAATHNAHAAGLT